MMKGREKSLVIKSTEFRSFSIYVLSFRCCNYVRRAGFRCQVRMSDQYIDWKEDNLLIHQGRSQWQVEH